MVYLSSKYIKLLIAKKVKKKESSLLSTNFETGIYTGFYCNRKGLILTPCWNCFFDLFSIAFVIIIIINGLPQRILPLCLTVKVPLFRPVSACRWQEEINTSLCLRLAILVNVCKIKGLFTLLLHLVPSLIHKRTGIQTQIRWLFWDVSLPSSLSASFRNKVIFLIPTSPRSDSLAYCAAAEHAWTQHYQRISKIRKILPLDPWVDTFDLCFFQGIWSFLLPIVDTKNPFGDQNYKRSKI